MFFSCYILIQLSIQIFHTYFLFYLYWQAFFQWTKIPDQNQLLVIISSPLSKVNWCKYIGLVFGRYLLLFFWLHYMVLITVALYYILKSGNLMFLALFVLCSSLSFPYFLKGRGGLFLLTVLECTVIYGEEGMATGRWDRLSHCFWYSAGFLHLSLLELKHIL